MFHNYIIVLFDLKDVVQRQYMYKSNEVNWNLYENSYSYIFLRSDFELPRPVRNFVSCHN